MTKRKTGPKLKPGPKPTPKRHARFSLHELSYWMETGQGASIGDRHALEELKKHHPEGFPEYNNGKKARSFCPREILTWVRSIRPQAVNAVIGAQTQYELWRYRPGIHKRVWNRPKGSFLEVDANGEPVLP